jgi:hypothetical protein
MQIFDQALEEVVVGFVDGRGHDLLKAVRGEEVCLSQVDGGGDGVRVVAPGDGLVGVEGGDLGEEGGHVGAAAGAFGGRGKVNVVFVWGVLVKACAT